MKFTKTEQKILSPKHEKWEKVILWMGIICLCLSISLIPYMINKINKIRDGWDTVHLKIEQKIEPATKQEAKLKSMLLEATAERKDIWLKYLTELSLKGVLFLLATGVFLIASYIRSRIYIKLIRKLQNSQQQTPEDG